MQTQVKKTYKEQQAEVKRLHIRKKRVATSRSMGYKIIIKRKKFKMFIKKKKAEAGPDTFH